MPGIRSRGGTIGRWGGASRVRCGGRFGEGHLRLPADPPAHSPIGRGGAPRQLDQAAAAPAGGALPGCPPAPAGLPHPAGPAAGQPWRHPAQPAPRLPVAAGDLAGPGGAALHWGAARYIHPLWAHGSNLPHPWVPLDGFPHSRDGLDCAPSHLSQAGLNVRSSPSGVGVWVVGGSGGRGPLSPHPLTPRSPLYLPCRWGQDPQAPGVGGFPGLPAGDPGARPPTGPGLSPVQERHHLGPQLPRGPRGGRSGEESQGPRC